MGVKLIIVRGLPNSGKTTYAKSFHTAMYEADMFFTNASGEYLFDPLKIKQAHEWCRQCVNQRLFFGETVVVSNNFTLLQEMQPYLDMATEYGASVRVICLKTKYDGDNGHNVPQEIIQKMSDRWEDFEGETIIE